MAMSGTPGLNTQRAVISPRPKRWSRLLPVVVAPTLYDVNTPSDEPDSMPIRPSVIEGMTVDFAIHTAQMASLADEIRGMPRSGALIAEENDKKRPRFSSMDR